MSSTIGSPIHCDSSTLACQDSSVGSLGHPELCHKPCLFLKYGTCPSGSACGYCHNQHKCKRFSKKKKMDLQLLGEANTLALILPHLLNKQLPADELIYLLDQHLASMPAPAAVVSVNTKQLNQCLKSMNFRQLVNLCKCKELPGLQDALLSLQANLVLENAAVCAQRFSM